MDNPPSPNNTPQPPEAESLKPRSEGGATSTAPQPATSAPKTGRRFPTYRPSHKATFIGLGAVIAILAINAIVFAFVLKKQTKDQNLANKSQVTLSTADLNKLGINRSSIGETGVELTVNPDAQFKGKVSVAGDATLSGKVTLNNTLTGAGATLTQLQAGDTSLSKLTVNGDTTSNSLNLRKDLVVAGVTQLQGAVTLRQLLTVNSNATVTGNLSVGGVLSVSSFSVQSLIVNGHLTSSGGTPSVGPGGPALGSNGTVSVSGNDTAGVIAINIGAGAGAGTLVNLAFNTAYGNVPRVVITPVGTGGNFYLLNLTSSGFSVAITSGLSPGGYRLDYIVIQ